MPTIDHPTRAGCTSSYSRSPTANTTPHTQPTRGTHHCASTVAKQAIAQIENRRSGPQIEGSATEHRSVSLNTDTASATAHRTGSAQRYVQDGTTVARQFAAVVASNRPIPAIHPRIPMLLEGERYGRRGQLSSDLDNRSAGEFAGAVAGGFEGGEEGGAQAVGLEFA